MDYLGLLYHFVRFNDCIFLFHHLRLVQFLFFSLCRMIEKTMSSAYDIVCQLYYYLPPKNDADQTGTSALSPSSFDLPKEFFQMLTACGPYLHRDTQLLQKVSSIFLPLLHHYIASAIYT